MVLLFVSWFCCCWRGLLAPLGTAQRAPTRPPLRRAHKSAGAGLGPRGRGAGQSVPGRGSLTWRGQASPGSRAVPCRAAPTPLRSARHRSEPAGRKLCLDAGHGGRGSLPYPRSCLSPLHKIGLEEQDKVPASLPNGKGWGSGGKLPAGAFGWPRAPLGAFPLVPAPGEDGRRFGLSEESGKHLPRCFSLGFLPPPKPRREPGSASTSSPPHPGSHRGLGTSGGPSVSRESQGDPASSRGGCPHRPGSPRPTPRRDSLAAGRGLRFT